MPQNIIQALTRYEVFKHFYLNANNSDVEIRIVDLKDMGKLNYYRSWIQARRDWFVLIFPEVILSYLQIIFAEKSSVD